MECIRSRQATRRTSTFLGLFLLAVAAIGVLASTSLATPLTWRPSKYPAALTATSVGSQTLVVTSEAGTKAEVSCKELAGHAITDDPGVDDVEITLTDVRYSGCSTKLGEATLPATVDMTGCDYLFHGGEEVGEHEFTEGEVDLLCPEGVTGPDIYTYQNAEHKTKVCSYTLWSFEGGEVAYENTTGSPNDFDFAIEGLKTGATRSQGILCPKPSEEAAYSGEATIRAFELEGVSESGTPEESEQIGIKIRAG